MRAFGIKEKNTVNARVLFEVYDNEYDAYGGRRIRGCRIRGALITVLLGGFLMGPVRV